MAASLDDLLYVAAALRVDVRSGFDSLERALAGRGTGASAAAPTPGAGGAGGVGAIADKAAASFVKAGIALSVFTGTFEKMIQGLGAGLTKFVALANPAVVMRFDMAIQNAMSALGRVFIPLLERFTVIIQGIGNAIESLSPTAKQLIEGLAGGAGLTSILGAVTVAASMLIKTLGVWPTIIATVVGAFAGIMMTMQSGQEMMASFNNIFKIVGSLFEKVAQFLIPIAASTVGPVLRMIGEALASSSVVLMRIVSTLGPAIKAVMEIFGALVQVAVSLAVAIQPLSEAILVPLAALISVIAKAIAADFVPALVQMAEAVKQVADFIARNVKKLMDAIGLESEADSLDFDPTAKKAQAVRQSQITDLRNAANKTYTSAYGGAGADPMLAESKTHTKLLADILKALGGDPSKGTRGPDLVATGRVGTGKSEGGGFLGWAGRRTVDAYEGAGFGSICSTGRHAEALRMTPFTPGELTAAQANQLNQLMRTKEQFDRMSVAPPLSLSRAAGIPNIRLTTSVLGDSDVIAEITGNDGAANPIHTAKEKGKDSSDNIIDANPPVTYTQVLNVPPPLPAIPTGTLVLLVPIEGETDWWWAIPIGVGNTIDVVTNVCDTIASCRGVTATTNTMTQADTIIQIDPTSNNVAVTLPAWRAGDFYIFKRITGGVHTVTISPPSGTIDGAGSFTLVAQWASKTVCAGCSSGTWIITAAVGT